MQKLDEIISNVFKVNLSDIQTDEDLKSLEHWDSLNHMLFITELEKNYNFQLSAEEIISMTNIRNIKLIIKKHQQ